MSTTAPAPLLYEDGRLLLSFAEVDRRMRWRNGKAKEKARIGELRTQPLNGRLKVPVSEVYRLSGVDMPDTVTLAALQAERQRRQRVERRIADLHRALAALYDELSQEQSA